MKPIWMGWAIAIVLLILGLALTFSGICTETKIKTYKTDKYSFDGQTLILNNTEYEVSSIKYDNGTLYTYSIETTNWILSVVVLFITAIVIFFIGYGIQLRQDKNERD